MANVLVTGAAGFIGSHLAQGCLEQGHNVFGIDSFTSYYEPELKRENVAQVENHAAWTFLEGDLVDLDLVSLLDGIDIVFHLAAQPGVRASWGQTFGAYVDSNVTALQRLLEASRSVALERFVFASSSSVYGDAERLPTNEATSLQPISPYGATKALGEHLCRLYHRSHALPIVTLRYFTVYGPRQRPDMAFNKLMRAALEHEEIVIYGDGGQTRDFTFVRDAVDGTIAAAVDGHPGAVYNLGGGARTSMNEVLEMIADLTGEDLNVRRVAAQAGDARDTAADTSRARAQLGFAPSRSLYEGLSEQIAWHRGESRPVATAPGLES
jgi:nucleoside-diphosphate-sugar epimerase